MIMRPRVQRSRIDRYASRPRPHGAFVSFALLLGSACGTSASDGSAESAAPPPGLAGNADGQTPGGQAPDGAPALPPAPLGSGAGLPPGSANGASTEMTPAPAGLDGAGDSQGAPGALDPEQPSPVPTGSESDYADPGRGPWERVPPEDCGLDAARLDDGNVANYAIFRYGKMCHIKGADSAGQMFSATKTLGGTMVGRAAFLTRDIPRSGPGTGTILPEDRAVDIDARAGGVSANVGMGDHVRRRHLSRVRFRRSVASRSVGASGV